MARYTQVTSGAASTAANIGRHTAEATSHASNTTSDFISLATAVNTDTFTAPSLVDKAYGVGVFMTSNNLTAGAVIRAILQHDIGAGFVDTTCVVDFTVGSMAGYSDYIFFNAQAAGVAFTFATVTANKYRWKIYKLSGTGTLLRCRSSTTSTATPWAWFVDSRNTTLTTTDDLTVGNFVNSTLTNAMSFGQGTGTSQSSTPLTFAEKSLFICPEATCRFDNTASTTVTIKGMIVAEPYAEFGIGTDSVAYPSSYVAKLIHDQNGVAGNYGIWTQSGNIVLNGANPTAYTVNYVSGLGTAASPMITSGDLGVVGDEVLVSTTGSFNQTEYRFIITKNSATSYVLSSTSGGSENALVNTHTTLRAKVANLQRNIIIEPASASFPNYILHTGLATTGKMYIKNIRTNSIGNANVGKFGITAGYSSGQATMVLQELSGVVSNAYVYSGFYLQTNRTDYTTYTDNIFCRSASGQPGITLSGTNNKIFTRWNYFDLAAVGMSITGAANITINNMTSHGVNTGAGSNNGHILVSGAAAQFTLNNCDFQWARIAAIRNLATNMVGWKFNGCTFGDVGTNTIDFALSAGSLADVTFSDCTFASATLLSGYPTMIEGSEVRYQNMDGNSSKHRWYTPHGSAWSSGSGLTDTTVRTASSLAIVYKPEDGTNGFVHEFLIPANPTSQVGIFGYLNRNATFSSGTIKVEIFLPGNTTTTADATQTMSTTTGSWLPFNISAYYSGSVTRYATVRITAITATANAYVFLDDLYDAGTGNKVAGLDLWYNGKPSPIMVAIDYSAVPAQVWGFTSSNTVSGTMGAKQVDAADNAEAAALDLYK